MSSSTATVNMRLKHVPTAADNSTYQGKLSYTVSIDDGTTPGNCSGTLGQTNATSISYEKISSTSVTMQFNSGNFCGTGADPYVSASNFTVDPDKSVPTLTQGWANNFNTGLFNMNPANNGVGTYQFAWQAGSLDDASRTFNAVTSQSGANFSGTAFFGYGPTMQTGAGSITKMICPWTGPQSDHTGVSLVQRQTIALDTTTGIWL